MPWYRVMIATVRADGVKKIRGHLVKKDSMVKAKKEFDKGLKKGKRWILRVIKIKDPQTKK